MPSNKEGPSLPHGGRKKEGKGCFHSWFLGWMKREVKNVTHTHAHTHVFFSFIHESSFHPFPSFLQPFHHTSRGRGKTHLSQRLQVSLSSFSRLQLPFFSSPCHPIFDQEERIPLQKTERNAQKKFPSFHHNFPPTYNLHSATTILALRRKRCEK